MWEDTLQGLKSLDVATDPALGLILMTAKGRQRKTATSGTPWNFAPWRCVGLCNQRHAEVVSIGLVSVDLRLISAEAVPW
ncbi:hypothetical protein FHT86_006449 [Rhizobium sp. BK313]|nr:hypothetical protein [Rhizobium sp. BK313]